MVSGRASVVELTGPLAVGQVGRSLLSVESQGRRTCRVSGPGILAGSRGEATVNDAVIIGGGTSAQGNATIRGGGSMDVSDLLIFARPGEFATVEVTGRTLQP